MLPKPPVPQPTTEKTTQLAGFHQPAENSHLTTDQGVGISQTENSLTAGVRGPTLLEDFHLREKIMRFDHERIPERVVHARGAGAHGTFQVYESLARYTTASFLTNPALITPVFVRFSTVVGSRGSADTVRDVRGFAAKFYTEAGNFDLVGNNMPVFFIQDGIKFPDLVHALKPDPRKEIPQASSAHDRFWDFISLMPETAHMVMWVMSDRGIPRSYRMMEGFGVHTFRLVNAEGMSHLVKFHWKPLLGMHGLAWEEAQQLAGKDADFHRRDLWDAIEAGNYPEYELGIQVVPEADVLKYGFDLLDPTKLLPEELVPVQRIGKLTLNSNPTNFFAETEQVAFCVANLVPGIDVTEDPLLQARLFSYLDTQITRLGGPNFAELPINRPLATVHNHQHDGFGRHGIPTGGANYHPNSIGGGFPKPASMADSFSHFRERINGSKVRERSESFSDHFSQARLFLDSLSEAERRHLTNALRFELSKVTLRPVRQRVVDEILAPIDYALALEIAEAVDVNRPDSRKERAKRSSMKTSPALSMVPIRQPTIATRRVAALVADGFQVSDLTAVRAGIEAGGATLELLAPTLSPITGDDGTVFTPTHSLQTTGSITFDAVLVPGGQPSIASLCLMSEAIRFMQDAYLHSKTIGLGRGAIPLFESAIHPTLRSRPTSMDGVIEATLPMKEFVANFIAMIAQHRHWSREA